MRRSLADIHRFGDYGLSPSESGKYFAFTEADAWTFARTQYASRGRMTITTIEVPQSIVRQGFAHPDPGGAGTALHLADDILLEMYKVMSPIRNLGHGLGL